MSLARNPFRQIFARSRGVAGAVLLFSGIVNLLALTGSFYMLQVYDRVLASRSVSTLIAISVLCLGLYALHGLLEIVRTQVMTRLAARLERDLLTPVHELLLKLPLAGSSPADSTQPLRDMETMRGALSGPAPIAFIDLPWMPFYLFFVFMLHPVLGVVSLVGMAVLIFLTVLTERRMRAPIRDVVQAGGKRMTIADTARRNAEVIRAMGFSDRTARRFNEASAEVQKASGEAADISGTLGAISRIFRMALQSAVLGIGALLVIQNMMSPGAIIAASIVVGRAIAPVEMAIGNWRLFTSARQAWERLERLMGMLGQQKELMPLPLPHQKLEAEGLTVAAPGQRTPIFRGRNFALNAGDAVAVLGPSGAGKSTFVRGLVGAWHPIAGTVRLDGAPLEQYPPEMIGQIIGYLPQEVDLFDGTIAENIARLDPGAPESAVIAAARSAGIHEMILRLPEGYNLTLGESGSTLSAGQRQRIGLARALYGDPFLVVLDEPNAHLDQEGEAALATAVAGIRARGGIVVIIAHRPAILSACNLVAYVAGGEMKGFGPRDEMMPKIEASMKAGANPTPAPPVTREPAPAQPKPQATMVAPPPAAPDVSTPRPAPQPPLPPILSTGTRITGRLSRGPRQAGGEQPAPAGASSTKEEKS